MRLTFRPLKAWTDPETIGRKPGRFSADWTDTIKLLDFEIDMLANGNNIHTDVVLEVAADESAMRLDGGLRADARVDAPGVVISFEGPNGPLRFACDTFEAGSKWVGGKSVRIPAWQQNVRAIALTLESLRAVDRYGASKSGQQYMGFSALPPGTPMPAAKMTVAEAAGYIFMMAGNAGSGFGPSALITNAAHRESCYRYAAKRLHPDAGGSTEDFQRLQEAKRVLDEATS